MLEAVETGTTRKTSMTIDEMEATHRIKYIVVSYDCLLGMFNQGRDGRYFRVRGPGLPKDAMFVGFSDHFLFRTNQLMIKIYSAEFDVVEEAGVIPELVLEYDVVEITGKQDGYKYGGVL